MPVTQPSSERSDFAKDGRRVNHRAATAGHPRTADQNSTSSNANQHGEMPMTVQLPTVAQILNTAEAIGLNLTEADAVSFQGLLKPSIAAYNTVDAMADNLPPVRYPRTPGYRPTGEENTHNAWYIKTTVKGAADGKLKNKTVVLKDNIMLAGVPM